MPNLCIKCSCLQVTGQETLFDGLHWFASVKKTLEEAVVSLQECDRGPEQKGGRIAGFKLWSQPPPVSSEAQKVVIILSSKPHSYFILVSFG